MTETKYKIIYSSRRSVSIMVSPGKGVIVRAPYRVSVRTIEKFVSEKSAWIMKHLDSHAGLHRINHGKQYTNGEEHLFLGEMLVLKVTSSARTYIKRDKNQLEICLPDTGNTGKIKAMLDEWNKTQAKNIIPVMFNEILERSVGYEFRPKGLVVKFLKSRWGSCNSKGMITLNAHLVKLNRTLIRYVISHELCHLKHHNHGKDFYMLLEEMVPDYKLARKELRKYVTG